jgi:hypothetical protein
MTGCLSLAGVPTIRENQKHGAANLQNLSTVATFFSAGKHVLLLSLLNCQCCVCGRCLELEANDFGFNSYGHDIAVLVRRPCHTDAKRGERVLVRFPCLQVSFLR